MLARGGNAQRENQFLKPPNPDTRVYSEGFCLFPKIKLVKTKFLHCQMTFWKNSGKSIFYISEIQTKTLKNKFRIVILQHFIRKLFFKVVSNHAPCTFTFMRFLVRALPVVRNHFWKQFSNKVLLNNSSKFFWSVAE